MDTTTAAMYANNLAALDLGELIRVRDSLARCVARSYVMKENAVLSDLAERFVMAEDEISRRR